MTPCREGCGKRFARGSERRARGGGGAGHRSFSIVRASPNFRLLHDVKCKGTKQECLDEIEQREEILPR